jgi:mannosyl-3-phosphoglycerate phosphatase
MRQIVAPYTCQLCHGLVAQILFAFTPQKCCNNKERPFIIMRQLIIFTDLDGTLLDHDGYSIAGARAALERIRRKGIPLVFTSSKTRAEIEDLLKTLSLLQPFIVENGGGLFFPSSFRLFDLSKLESAGPYRVRRFGASYAAIRRFVERHGPAFGARGFGDMTVDEVAALTGLTMRQASLAKEREFTEPFVCEGSVEAFRRLAESSDLAVTRGGRFYHLMGSGQDKGRAVREAMEIWRAGGRKLVSIGLGDSPNDEPLLDNVDLPVLMPRADGSFADLQVKKLLRAPLPGSSGWGAVVMELLDALEEGSGVFSLKNAEKETGHG